MFAVVSLGFTTGESWDTGLPRSTVRTRDGTSFAVDRKRAPLTGGRLVCVQGQSTRTPPQRGGRGWVLSSAWQGSARRLASVGSVHLCPPPLPFLLLPIRSNLLFEAEPWKARAQHG